MMNEPWYKPIVNTLSKILDKSYTNWAQNFLVVFKLMNLLFIYFIISFSPILIIVLSSYFLPSFRYLLREFWLKIKFTLQNNF